MTPSFGAPIARPLARPIAVPIIAAYRRGDSGPAFVLATESGLYLVTEDGAPLIPETEAPA